MTEQEVRHEKATQRAKLRGLYTDETGETGPRRDLFAAFIQRRFPGKARAISGTVDRSHHAEYVREWARSFSTGRAYWKMDRKSAAAYMAVLIEGPGDGTAAPFNPNTARNAWMETLGTDQEHALQEAHHVAAHVAEKHGYDVRGVTQEIDTLADHLEKQEEGGA